MTMKDMHWTTPILTLNYVLYKNDNKPIKVEIHIWEESGAMSCIEKDDILWLREKNLPKTRDMAYIPSMLSFSSKW